MKNFTNNFKQFTSRLSARWLIMTLMMLVGTSSAWAKTVYYVNKSGCSTIKIYFWGGSPSTSWNDSPSMEPTDECVKDGNNTYQVYKFDVGTNTSCIFRCDNSQTGDLTVNDGKDYYNGSWKSKSDLNIVKIEPTTIYFDNSNTGWTSIYLWIGKSTENGGNENYSNGSYQMTRIDNCGEIYKYELYNEWSDATEISFTNTNWGAEGNSICHRYGYLSGNATHIYKTSIADANNIVFKASSTTSKAEKNGTYCNCTIGNNQQNNKKFHEFESTETFSPSMCCTSADVTISDWNISTLCPSSSGTFTYTAAPGATVTWKMYQNNSDYAITSNNGNVTITYKGTSTINSNKLLYTVSGNGICPEEDVDSKKTISTAAKPSISELSDQTQTICDGTMATLTVTSGKGTYTWVNTNGGENISDTDNSVQVRTAGTYTVTATDANGCESDAVEFIVTVKELQGKPVFADASQTVCESTQFTLPSEDKNGATLVWYTSAGALQNASVSGITEQTKYYAAIADNGTKCETASNNRTEYTVNVDSKPNLELTSSLVTICQGTEITLSNYENNNTKVGTVKWYSDENRNKEITDLTLTPSVGENKYYARATNGVCKNNADVMLTIKVDAQSVINLTSNNETICSGEQISLDTYVNNETTVGNPITWREGSVSGTVVTNPVSPQTTTTYYATTKNGVCSVSESKSLQVTVKQRPTAVDFVYSIPEPIEYDGNPHSVAVTWKNGGDNEGITILYDDSSEAPTAVGDYTVTVTADAHEDLCATTDAVSLGSFSILCSAPDIPTFNVTQHEVNCGTTNVQKGIIKITNPVSGYKYKLGLLDANTEYTLDGNNSITGVDAGSYRITAIKYCGEDKNSRTNEGSYAVVNSSDVKLTPTLEQTPIVQCKTDYTNGELRITNYSDDYTYTFTPELSEEPTINGNVVRYSISATQAVEYTVTATHNTYNTCSTSASITVALTDNTPTITNATIAAGKDAVCVNTGTTLTASATTDKGTLSYLWNTDATTESIETGNLTENTTYTVTITATNAGCAVSIPTVLSKTITVNPVSAPTITASANSGVNAIDLTISVADAGCAENYTLGYRIKQSDDLEYSENQVIKTNTTETQVSTTIDGLVTGVEYIIQAYIINGYNNNEVFYTDPITCTVLASENCDVPSANYIEILANNDENLQLYAWVEGTGTTPLGGWSGKTRDTWYEVNSTGYSVWKIESSDPVYIIFNKGDNSKTADIKGPNDEGLKSSYRYIFDVNLSTWNYTLQSQTLIADPEVETVSATPVRIDETKSNITLVGRIIKRGCADIRNYGFQYKLATDEDANYQNLQVGTGDIEPGSTFTGSLELGVGTYYLRARVENENGSKAYGKEIRVTIAERDLTIAAVDDDKDVDTDTYYDFVGLYMSSVTKPTTVDIKSYTWYKDGNEYNPTFTASNLYGETYINTNGTNNIRPNETGVYKLKVELSNGTILESNEIPVSKANAVSASSILTASNRTLPVISVRTNEDFPTCKSGSYPSAQADKLKKKRSVDVKIFDKNGKLYYDRKARMNYRGSSSLNFVKKSYAFCPGDEMCGDVEKGLDYVITKEVNMFNLGAEDKDWVLYAAAADPSLMRNRIVFDTYAAMTNKWGVKSMFVELVVDGEYKGVYVFMDKITKNKNRVNITAADGFIVKFDKTDTADRYIDGKQEKGDEKTFMTERTGRQGISTYGTTVDQMFEIEYPEKDDNKGTWNNIVASIKDKFETFETALAEGNYSKVREIIDYDSWADWFIINEYIKNQDAYRASCIFVYNGEKIEARPLWDQELSMNNTCRTSNGSGNTSGLLIENDGVYSDCFPAPFWFTGKNAEFGSCGGNDGSSTLGTAYSNYLLKDGCFIGLVQQKLADYLKEGAALYAGTDEKNGPLLKLATTFNKELTSKTEGQTSAQEREASFWTGKTRATADCSGDTGYTDKSYSTEYNNLSGWIKGDRDENLTSILGGMSGEMSAGISITTSPANAIVTPWIPITVTVNVTDGVEYIYDDAAISEGIALDVDKAITSKSGNKYTYTFPRPADWGNNNVDTPIQQIVYPITAKLKVYDTVCPGVNNETGVYIKLQDEGNDICGELVDQ